MTERETALRGDRGEPRRRRHDVEVPVPDSDVEGAVDETEVLQGGPDALDSVTRPDEPAADADPEHAPPADRE